MNTLFSDLRVGLRLLWRDRAFAITAGLTLAVCIGANTALLSVVRGVLLKPLWMPEADRVVMAGNMYPGAGVYEPLGAAVPDYFDRLREVTVFSEQPLFRQDNRSIDRDGSPLRVEGLSVTPSFSGSPASSPSWAAPSLIRRARSETSSRPSSATDFGGLNSVAIHPQSVAASASMVALIRSSA